MKAGSLVRFVLEAAFLVLVIAAAGVSGISLLWIAVAALGAWVLVALLELWLSSGSRPRSRPRPARIAPEASPEPVFIAARPQERAPLPVNVRTSAPRAWNLWELEQAAEDTNSESGTEERRLLLLHLRQFADAAGDLPPEFDPLVRDVFGAQVAT
jgi:hypothetical protein